MRRSQSGRLVFLQPQPPLIDMHVRRQAYVQRHTCSSNERLACSLEFLKHNEQTSPTAERQPPQNVSSRRLCTQAAAIIFKLMRLYKRPRGLRQICNICIYIIHSACIIDLLNLWDKNTGRDIIYGAQNLRKIAKGRLGARRTLAILVLIVQECNIGLRKEAAAVLARTEAKFGPYSSKPRCSNRTTGFRP